MTTFNDGESGLSVRTKINAVLQHADGTAGELVINDAGADVDFRVESDTNANTFFVDGATGNVGIGTVPSVRLHSYEFFGGTVARLQTGTTGNGNFLDFYNASAARQGIIGFIDATNLYVHNDGAGAVIFDTNNAERMRIDASGNLLIGTATSGASKLRISGLPTSSAGLSAGDVWNDGGTLKIA